MKAEGRGSVFLVLGSEGDEMREEETEQRRRCQERENGLCEMNVCVNVSPPHFPFQCFFNKKINFNSSHPIKIKGLRLKVHIKEGVHT